MSSPDKEKMDKKTQEFLDFVFDKGQQKMTNKEKAEQTFNNLLEYGNLKFYKFKNGKFNISKISRVSGLSRKFIGFKLWQKGLI